MLFYVLWNRPFTSYFVLPSLSIVNYLYVRLSGPIAIAGEEAADMFCF